MSPLIAIAPALPLHSAGKYVASAYIVFIALILIYVAIMAVRLSHNQRELAELKRELLERQPAPGSEQETETESMV
jgi:hypothetical protein